MKIMLQENYVARRLCCKGLSLWKTKNNQIFNNREFDKLQYIQITDYCTTIKNHIIGKQLDSWQQSIHNML